MKIIFNRQELINSIAPLLCAVPNKGPFPEVECIHMNAENPAQKNIICDKAYEYMLHR